MLRAMPSPTGTNNAKLYILDRRPQAAYDDAGGLRDDVALELLEFLRDKLSPEDHAKFAAMIGADPDAAMDQPVPFTGMPKPGGGEFGEDARRPINRGETAAKSFANRFPHAAKIKINY